jgi:hypothetical protein
MPKNQPSRPSDPAPPTGEIVLYQTEDGQTRVECRFVDETLWLSQALIAELFQVAVATVNEHLKNIFDEGEVQSGPTIRKFRMVRREGPREVEREIEHYNLDAILALGYRVRSERGTPAVAALGRRGQEVARETKAQPALRVEATFIRRSSSSLPSEDGLRQETPRMLCRHQVDAIG